MRTLAPRTKLLSLLFAAVLVVGLVALPTFAAAAEELGSAPTSTTVDPSTEPAAPVNIANPVEVLTPLTSPITYVDLSVAYGRVRIAPSSTAGMVQVTYTATSGGTEATTNMASTSNFRIIGDGGENTASYVDISGAVDVNVILQNVNLYRQHSHANIAPITVDGGATVDFLIDGLNYLSGEYCDYDRTPGLRIVDATVAVDSFNNPGSTYGGDEDMLYATGADACAGIGLDDADSAVSSTTVFTVKGAYVQAWGGYNAAAIGTGDATTIVPTAGSAKPLTSGANSFTINITGGLVNATGNWSNGTGIGTGYGFSGTSTINISGGEVYGYGGDYAVGIGLGYAAHDAVSNVNISGGTVTGANMEGEGYTTATGIGAGSDSYFDVVNNVTISGGTVTAHGGMESAGIGWGSNDDVDCDNAVANITISGGSVTADTMDWNNGSPAAIGTGGWAYNLDTNVSVTGGTVRAYGGEGGGTGIGLGGYTNDCTFAFDATGGTIIANSNYGAGIGSGYESAGTTSTISISGDTSITASTNYSGAGIGSGTNADNEKLTISIDGGTVNASNGDYGAAIGTGENDTYIDATINITEGDITAYGEYDGAAIGFGDDNVNTDVVINISGGTIDATADGESSGIGGAYYQEYSTLDINISGGDIRALGENAAAIGSGNWNYYVDVTVDISGGDIYAEGRNIDEGPCVGIGGQYPEDTNCDFNVEVNISGGTIEAVGSDRSAGIGAGDNDNWGGGDGNLGVDVNITGGDITARGGWGAAGVGTGWGSDAPVKINIDGGLVKAFGGEGAPGIGHGGNAYDLSTVDVRIGGGTVIAKGGVVMGPLGDAQPLEAPLPSESHVADIGAGTYSDTASDQVVEIVGGSVVYVNNWTSGSASATVDPRPINEANPTQPLYRSFFKVAGAAGGVPVTISKVTVGGVEYKPTADSAAGYGVNELVTYDDGTVQLWLPLGAAVVTYQAAGKTYTVAETVDGSDMTELTGTSPLAQTGTDDRWILAAAIAALLGGIALGAVSLRRRKGAVAEQVTEVAAS